MPMHDWTRVPAGIFHAFHNTWIGDLQKALNDHRLPPEYYALGEQRSGGDSFSYSPSLLAVAPGVPHDFDLAVHRGPGPAAAVEGG